MPSKKASEVNIELSSLKAYLLDKPFAIETYPFGEELPVFKVKNKMFALVIPRNEKTMLNLKCDPDEAMALRDIFTGITAGYHMDKRHWISVYFDGSVPDNELKRLIDNSYQLVVGKLTKKDQKAISVYL